MSGKKAFRTYWHANPESIFGEPSFFFQNKKATGKNRQYWGEGVCFSFGQACLLSCPANVTTTALWGKSVAQTREEKCFSCKTAAKTMDLHLSPCHLATNLTCFPLLGHLLVFQALLCFDFVSPPFNFCLKFARIKLQHLYPCFTVNPFSSGIVCEAFPWLSSILPWWFVAVIVYNDLWKRQMMRWQFNKLSSLWGLYCLTNVNIFLTVWVFCRAIYFKFRVVTALYFVHLTAVDALKQHWDLGPISIKQLLELQNNGGIT